MTSGRSKSTEDEQPREELEWVRLTLTAIGGLYGEVLERWTWNAYQVLDQLLADGSRPSDWLQEGAAAWIEGLGASAKLARGIDSALRKSIGPSDPQSGLDEHGDIVFYIDRHTEATDPVETKIPIAMINNVRVKKRGRIPEQCINLTKQGSKVFVALFDLQKRKLKLGKRPYDVELSWGAGSTKGSTKFRVKRV